MDQQVNQAVNQQAHQRKERHAQVTVLAALAMLAGVIGVIAGIITLASGTVFSFFGSSVPRPPGIVVLLGILQLAIGALYIGFSVGAWRLHNWAWPLGMAAGSLAIIVNGVRLIYNLFAFAKGEPVSGVVGPILALIVGGIILYYLFSDPVQRAFDL
jgi:uncharacterized membrane protein YjjP (DUF1212 family)